MTTQFYIVIPKARWEQFESKQNGVKFYNVFDGNYFRCANPAHFVVVSAVSKQDAIDRAVEKCLKFGTEDMSYFMGEQDCEAVTADKFIAFSGSDLENFAFIPTGCC